MMMMMMMMMINNNNNGYVLISIYVPSTSQGLYMDHFTLHLNSPSQARALPS